MLQPPDDLVMEPRDPLASLIAVEVTERRLGEMGGPYRRDPARIFGRVAKALTLAGAASITLGGRRRFLAGAGAVAVLAGGLAERWSIFSAGAPSAENPAYTVTPQRQRLDEGNGYRVAEEGRRVGGGGGRSPR